MKKCITTTLLMFCSVFAFAQVVPTESYFSDKQFTQHSVTCISPEGSANNPQAVCNRFCESSRMVGFSTRAQNKVALWADGKPGTWSYTTGKLTVTYTVASSTGTIVFTDVKTENGKLIVKTAGTDGYTCVFTYNVYDPNVEKANPNNFKQPKPAFK